MPQAARIMLFDLYHGGHHGQYIQALVNYWVEKALPGRLDVVVSKEFSERYPDLLETAGGHSTVAFHPTSEPVDLKEKSGRLAVLENDRRIGRILRRSVLEHRPDHCVLMYMDHVQLSLATDLRFDFPVRFSGIYFRPSFYYRRAGAAASTLRTLLDDLQKRMLVRLAMRNPHVDTLFSLDPYAVDHIRGLNAARRVVHLPEPFETRLATAEAPEVTRRHLSVEPGRQVLLLFGSLDPRKGVVQLLEALGELPDALASRICLVMAGEIAAAREQVLEAIEVLRARSAVQIVHRDAFVSDPVEMHNLFRAASLVLMPYQNHVGSSNVLVRAAAAGVPVLGQTFGMLGALIQDRRLGLCVDTTRPSALAEGLTRFLDPAAGYPFDADSARAFAAENTEETMASTLFGHLLDAM